MGRFRGYWWSPDGDRDRGVPRRRSAGRRMGDRRPGHAERARHERSATRRPGPTTPSSRCTCSGSTARRVDVDWDREFFPYVATVDWTDAGLLMLGPVSRDQRSSMRCASTPTPARPTVARRRLRRRLDRPRARCPGVPAGRSARDRRRSRRTSRRLFVDGEPVTPIDLQVRSRRRRVRATGITFQANPIGDATELHVWRWHDGEAHRRTHGVTPRSASTPRSSAGRRR